MWRTDGTKGSGAERPEHISYWLNAPVWTDAQVAAQLRAWQETLIALNCHLLCYALFCYTIKLNPF